MNLQTQIPFSKKSNNLIDYKSNILLLGSCFSENIGEKLEYHKIQNTQNPFGILFHPAAIERLIANAIEHKQYTEKDVFFHNEQWHCFEAHSQLSHTSKEALINGLNANLNSTFNKLQNATHIIMTLGTAWAYRYLKTGEFVANCHKVPQSEFEKVLLSVEDITETLKNIIAQIRSINYNVEVVFTVSPIRHIKDGFIENTQSKAHLISSIHQIIGNKSSYFPSYEIMMDELRDYRFYSEDMIHPNQTAINYIWERFKMVWISEDSYSIMDEVDTIQKGLRHKPFNPDSDAHKAFVEKLQARILKLKAQFPHFK
ncbi:GSCFA domain-containing protein [Algibacter luteus]|uniref:GSCFA domain-containing protein n=1 Tax=Algibacter luteus TaxID=1178825 RepID=UPI002598D534|nr:GSCFA domain-containing protein [Algibacter luteus]WJJ96317.1 GSCFA domain-containing protein [Algibacter luteus]